MRFVVGHGGPRSPGCTPEPRGDHFALPILDGAAFTLVSLEDVDWASKWRWTATHGYAVRNDRGRTIRLHREVLGLVHGDGLQGDHINGNRLDNRRSNLRVVSAKGNSQNQLVKRGVSSRYRGVSWNKDCQKWQVHVRVDGRSRYFGVYADEDEAGRVARELRAKHMPFATN